MSGYIFDLIRQRVRNDMLRTAAPEAGTPVVSVFGVPVPDEHLGRFICVHNSDPDLPMVEVKDKETGERLRGRALWDRIWPGRPPGRP